MKNCEYPNCKEAAIIRAAYYADDGSWPSRLCCDKHADEFTAGASGVSKQMLFAVSTKDLEQICPQ